MSTNSTNPSNDAPLSSGEAILLAWIEDDLAPDQRVEVEQRLSADPRLMRRAESLRADRDSLRALPDEPAPMGLLDSVADAIEREMLVGVTEEGVSLIDGPVQSIVKPAKPSRFAFLAPLVETTWGRRTSGLAAALLLLGVAGWMLTGVLKQRQSPPDPTDTNTPIPSQLSGPDRIAMGDPSPLNPDASQANALAESSDATTIVPEITDTDVETMLAAADTDAQIEQPVVEPTMTLAEAYELLLEGRLAVRSLSASPTTRLSAIDALGAEGRRARVVREPAETLLASIPSRRELEQGSTPNLDLPGFPTTELADDGTSEGTPAPRIEGAPRAMLEAPTHARLEGIRSIEMDADEALLGRVLDRLRRELGEIELVELETPAPPPAADLAPERVLWWKLEPDQWTPTASMPVIVEGYE